MSLRKYRLADEVRDVLASCFLGGQMQDPRLEGVTITAVKLSGDLQVATVYYRVYDETQKKGAQQGLERASGFLKKRVADAVDVRRVPELRFFYDESIERAARIESLLDKI